MKYGCIGEKLGHSYSAEIHALFGEYEYVLKELAPEAVPAFLEKRDFCGINVTIPYKQTVIPFLDRVDKAARAVGAVNTIVNRNGVLTGYNTDLFGMTAMLERAGISPAGKKALILGTGGTSRTAHAVFRRLNASETVAVSRTAGEGRVTYAEAALKHADAGIVMNTTPAGMYPNAFASPIDLDPFPALTGVADAVYNPLRTCLFLSAAARGIPAVCGLYMLVAQALASCELFIGKRYDPALADRVYGAVRASKQNVVLIGMPGSGKTTLGRMLAEKTGKRFTDTDALIEEKAGCTVAGIFARQGETAFRALETQTLRELAQQTGLVIATGGGAPLRSENVLAMKLNGRVFFLDRSPALLVPTPDRPLALTREALEQRYRERIGVYRAAADFTVQNDGEPEAAAEAIEKELLK